MDFRQMNRAQMAAVGAAWLDPERARRDLESVPAVFALIPRLQDIHIRLVAAPTAHAQREFDARTAELDRVDPLHDRMIRGVHYVLTALAERADEPAVAEQWKGLRERLLPQGLRTTQLSYPEEAGRAELLAASLDAPTRAQLKKVKTPWGTTLDEEVAGIIEAGRRVGRLDHERQGFAQQRDDAHGDASSTSEVRQEWTRLARAIVSTLDAVVVDPATKARILAPLHDALTRGEARVRGAQTPTAEPSPASLPRGEGNGISNGVHHDAPTHTATP